MKLNIHTATDIESIATVCNIYSYKNMHGLVRQYAETQVPKGEDLEVEIASELIPPTYRYNPSLLAQKIQVQISEQFQSSAGSVLNGEGRVMILLQREPKQRFQRYHPKPSVKQIIKEWLALPNAEAAESEQDHLDIPLEIIPAFYASHPEQLAYQVKLEAKQPIRIKRFKTLWRISRK